MKPWKEFEKLAEQIYGELAPAAIVKWDDHIRGVESEAMRQIDVSIKWSFEEKDRLVIVQVKNWNHKADIKAVGEFASVVRDVRANGGILVCKSGFTNNALRYARNIGIHLHNLHDAQKLEWASVLTVPIVWIDQIPMLNMSVVARFEAGDSFQKEDGSGVVLREGMDPISDKEKFIQDWNYGKLDRSTEKVHGYDPGGPVWTPVRTAKGLDELRPSAEAGYTYQVRQKSWLGEFSPDDWRGLRDYLSDSLIVSHLPLGQVPVQRDDNWVEIPDPSKIALMIDGSFITSESFQVDAASSESTLDMQYLSP